MIYKAAFVIVVAYLFHHVSCRKIRTCFPEGAECNPLYVCPCCPKLYFEDGTDQGIENNVGLFCNMEGAVIPKADDQQFLRGCCQRCTTESDGCTDVYTPCCQDYIPVQDPSCPEGQTKCQKPDSIPTYKDAENIPRECTGKVPDCYAEGQQCTFMLWTCCTGLTCDISATRSTWGFCKRDPSYTGTLDPAPTPYPSPVAPTSPKCPTYVNVTSTAGPIPDGSSTAGPIPDGPSTLDPVSNGQSTAGPVPDGPSSAGPVTSNYPECNLPPPSPQPQGCQIEGGYCDDFACCEELKCPENWWPLWILRWLLNWVGLWYRRCRNYPPLTWYNPLTWYDY